LPFTEGFGELLCLLFIMSKEALKKIFSFLKYNLALTSALSLFLSFGYVLSMEEDLAKQYFFIGLISICLSGFLGWYETKI
jgi:hypothetical protein